MDNIIVDIMPKACGKCEYGITYDLSIDDLVTKCKLTNCEQDWCDFPNRNDGTLRMFGCPLKLK
jgi:hypothetical protein